MRLTITDQIRKIGGSIKQARSLDHLESLWQQIQEESEAAKGERSDGELRPDGFRSKSKTVLKYECLICAKTRIEPRSICELLQPKRYFNEMFRYCSGCVVARPNDQPSLICEINKSLQKPSFQTRTINP